ncbi:uncharacterized protein LOC123866270 [Maniola jurtina]|uniref:uncharacterized protein LOC123866270 n=1 Tax=Maniola jurtina TaxID=191418 RepID=UPI001E68B723|nr:uncharacterized protein LOC123866270 [Maniola jurtina]
MREVLAYLRNRGFQSVCYLDDILCISDTYDQCLDNVNETLKILHCLGFVVNYDKSNLTPQQSCKFLGFVYDTKSLSIYLPTDKRFKIAELVAKFTSLPACSIREFAHLIGVLVAACPAAKYAWMYTKILERQKYLALRKYGNYEAKIKLSNVILDDLNWWSLNIDTTSNFIRQPNFKLEIYSDASRTGWGAVCKNNQVSGRWKATEKANHINYLELMAAFLGLKSFASDVTDCAILLRIDNTTAISYVNRMGGIQYPHLNDLARVLWKWCEQRGLWIFASYVNTKENCADAASRVINPDTEWSLSDEAFHDITQYFGQPEIDLFASRDNAKCSRFVSWKPDPDAVSVDAFTVNWHAEYFYAFPPFSLILKCLRKIIDDKADGILRSSSLAQAPYPGCREALRQSFIRKGACPASSTLMLASLSDSTVKQYNTSLKLWWQYCVENNVDVFEPSKKFILTFLTTQFNNGCAYGSLNSHRSALSAFIGNNIGSDECVKRLLKGAYKSRPVQSKYSSTWDPQVVLNLISTWFPNTELSLEKITKKLVVCLALCTAHRVQTLSLIKLDNIKFSENGVKIMITDLIKTSAPGRNQPVLCLPYFRENVSICPATVLSDYISKTRNIRPEGTDTLLLTHKRPHKPATTQSISRWIKQVLSESGVDVGVFGAHSTRHASTSAASSAGVNIETIRKTAGWTSSSDSFARFYNRIILDEGEFARSVCLRNQ